MSRDVDNSQDLMDSRDVIARIEELQDERDTLATEVTDAAETLKEGQEDGDEEKEALQDALDAATEALKEWIEGDEGAELRALQAFADELSGYADDWQHGCTIIRDSYFETYMDEMLEDIGDLPKNLPYYLTITVDYDALKQDYTSAEFDGTTYWVR